MGNIILSDGLLDMITTDWYSLLKDFIQMYKEDKWTSLTNRI